MDTRWARAADGTRLAYRLRGAGTPLLLLPGQANDHTWWNRIADDLARRHLLVLPDPRGTGRSEEGPDVRAGYSTRGLAGDAIAVLDAAGLATAHLYGASMGGRVAQWIAAEHPGRVRGVVLGCTSPGGEHGVERSPEVRASLDVRDADLRASRLLELMYSPGWLDAHPGPYPVLGSPTMTARTRRAHLRASENHDAWDVLPTITAPTLVLHGGQDRMTPPDNVELLTARIPHARGLVLPGARHAYFDEAAAVATPAVLEHLAAADWVPGARAPAGEAGSPGTGERDARG